ncbi:MAG TPA: VanZ family protein [Vicinamibacterales bacterium]
MKARPAETRVSAGAGLLRPAFLWTPPVLYAAAIFMFSAISDPPGLPGDVSDKWQHALAYAGLTLLLIRAFAGGNWRGVTVRACVLSLVVAVLYGVTDELHQLFVPGRHADVMDLAADALGATAAAVLAGGWGRVVRARTDARI